MTTSPEEDDELVGKLAAMTDNEFQSVVSKARGTTKQMAVDALVRWQRQFTITTENGD